MSDNRNPRFADFEQHLVQCPACGSFDHDGWTNHKNCPEDWTVWDMKGFPFRRLMQSANEKVVQSVSHCSCGRGVYGEEDSEGRKLWFHYGDDSPVCEVKIEFRTGHVEGTL